MGEEFTVYSDKVIRYLNDATIVARLAHWNVRGKDFYSCHLLFERIYNSLADHMDGMVEVLRSSGYEPDFNVFSGPGISMQDVDCGNLIDLVQDYSLALQSAVGIFYRFAEEVKSDPRMVAISNALQSLSQTCATNLYLLQSTRG